MVHWESKRPPSEPAWITVNCLMRKRSTQSCNVPLVTKKVAILNSIRNGHILGCGGELNAATVPRRNNERTRTGI
jgi:hypothetical protein